MLVMKRTKLSVKENIMYSGDLYLVEQSRYIRIPGILSNLIINYYKGMTVSLDMTVTLLNREMYRSNISQSRKRVVYRAAEREHGYTNIISIADLLR